MNQICIDCLTRIDAAFVETEVLSCTDSFGLGLDDPSLCYLIAICAFGMSNIKQYLADKSCPQGVLRDFLIRLD